jgi:hypothetical protein
MALGQQEQRARRYYLTISDGQIVHSENGKKEYYSYVEGTLEKIYKLERTFNGETVLYWYIDIRDEKGELYSISLPYKSGTFKSIVLALASEQAIALSTIKIEPYKKGEFTKVVVSSNGQRLDWIVKELPAVEEVFIAGERIKDDTKRMAYIYTLVEQINARLK